MKIKYSPSAKERLVQLKKTKHQETVNKIVITIKSPIFNPERCPKVENMLGIANPYYFIHVEHNYVFYRIANNIIYITDIYNEKEDFMWKMFGIKLRSDESIEYWGE